MKIDTEAIVLRSVKYGESDLIVNVFSKKFGKIGIYAKNARKIKSKFLSSTQILAYANMIVNVNSDKYNLYSSELIENNFKITNSFEKLYLAYYYLQFIDRVAIENVSNIKLFNHLVKSIQILKENENILLQKVVFDIKIIDILGVKPILNHCIECGKKSNIGTYFSVIAGGRTCLDCIESNYLDNIKIDKTSFRLIDYITNFNFEEIASAKIDESLLREVNHLFDDYIDHHFDNINLNTRDMLIF